MRISWAPRTLALAAIALLAVPAALPASALATQAVPDEIDDPVAAMEPEIEVAEPRPQPKPQPQPRPQAQAAAPAPTVAGIDEAPVPGRQAVASAADVPAATTTIRSGSLPFTGPEPGLLVLLLLVGSVALCGGAVAFAHARAIADAA